MKLLHQLIKYFWLLIIISFGLGGNLKLENNNDGTWNVIYDSSPEEFIAGFHFDVDGDGVTIDSAYGGEVEAAGFIIDNSSTSVIGEVGLSGALIPSPMIGGTLIVLDLTGEPTGLSNMVFSDLAGNAMDFTFIWEGCIDELACNYNEYANTNDGTCMYPCSNADGCDTDDSEYETDFYLFDCSGHCIVGLDCVGECGGPITDGENCTGCMDDGYQQLSPNPGSPACNYAQFAIIDGECLYNDCLGECGGTADEDCSGTCLDLNDENWDFSCLDCNEVINGEAYLDGCGVCVGGDTGNDDVFDIGIDSLYLNIPSGFENHRVSVNASNVGTLNSFYMELDYDSIYIQIVDFIDGIELYNYDYELAHSDSIINNTSIKRVRFSLFYSPHPFDCSQYNIQQCENSGDCFLNLDTGNCERKLNQFSNECNDENKDVIFQIKLNASEVSANIYTPISIHNLVLNENPLDIIKDWDILVFDPEGCSEEEACNYNPNTLFPDNEVCEYPGDENWLGCDCEGNEPDDCDVCGGEQNDGDIDNNGDDCEIDCPDGNEPDCNNDCVGSAYIDSNCGEDFCVGGNTDDECIENCSDSEEECTGPISFWDGTDCWNAEAYLDACENCIANDIDCFYSSFNIYNSIGNVFVDTTTIPEFENFYVALHMQNLPDSLEGIIVNLEFDASILYLNDWSINPNDLDIEGDLTGELGSSYILEGEIIDTTFRASIFGNTNEFYQGNGGNILFLQFSNLGINGDSTVISYNKVQVNEHVMKEQNYTSQVIYFGDCYGVFNGETPLDECGICGGPGIPEGVCDCEGNTTTDLYGEGYNCEGVLSLNESLIPKSFALNQNYPNPFNPITYIQYSVPQFDFVTIEIININGQKIKTIVQSSHQPGNYEIMWDGTNHYGISVPSGIYFYKLDADEFISVKKLVLLK